MKKVCDLRLLTGSYSNNFLKFFIYKNTKRNIIF